MDSTDIIDRTTSENQDSKLKAEVVINGESLKENGNKELSNGTEPAINEVNDEKTNQKDVHTEEELENGSKYDEKESIGTEESIDVVGDKDESVEPEEEKEIKETNEANKKRTAQVVPEESYESPTTKSQLSEKFTDICNEENKTNFTNETTPDFIRTKYGSGLKMSGRRPLRGIVSPHPASKRKASFSVNDSPDTKKMKETSSAERSRWNYFSSPSFRFWSYKESVESINGQQVSPNDSMVVNVDDLSVINNRLDDSQFENNWPEGNKPFWRMCNLM